MKYKWDSKPKDDYSGENSPEKKVKSDTLQSKFKKFVTNVRSSPIILNKALKLDILKMQKVILTQKWILPGRLI
jgi:hypothetical protein